MAVTKGHGNPKWTRDETILALELYQDINGRVTAENKVKLIELSQFLQSAPFHSDEVKKDTFRNIEGVGFKIQNLRAAATGKGLNNISSMDKTVWKELGNDPVKVKKLAKEIKENVESLATLDQRAHAQTGYGKSWTYIDDSKVVKFIDTTLIKYKSTRLPKKIRPFFTQGKPVTDLLLLDGQDTVAVKVVKSEDSKGSIRYDLRLPSKFTNRLEQFTGCYFLSFEKIEGLETIIVRVMNEIEVTNLNDIPEDGKVIASKIVDIEENSVENFDISGSEQSVGERRESSLVSDYCSYKGIIKPQRNKITFNDGKSLYTDLYIDKTLFEAKSNTARSSIRMAIGQLFDYENLMGNDEIKKVILLPKKPPESLIELLNKLDIGLVYKDGDIFEEHNLE